MDFQAFETTYAGMDSLDQESLLPYYLFSFGSNIYFLSVAFMYYSRRRADYLSQRHHTLTHLYAISLTFLSASLSLNLPWFHFILLETPCVVHFVIQHLFCVLLLFSLVLRIALLTVRHYYMVVGINWSLKQSINFELTPIEVALLRVVGTFAKNVTLGTGGPSPSTSQGIFSGRSERERLAMDEPKRKDSVAPCVTALSTNDFAGSRFDHSTRRCSGTQDEDVNADIGNGFPTCISGTSWLGVEEVCKPSLRRPSLDPAHVKSFSPEAIFFPASTVTDGSRMSAQPDYIPIFSHRGTFHTVIFMLLFSVVFTVIDAFISSGPRTYSLSSFALCPMSSAKGERRRK